MLWSWSKRTIFDKNQTRRKITRKKGEISVSKHVGRTTLESRVSNFEDFSPLKYAKNIHASKLHETHYSWNFLSPSVDGGKIRLPFKLDFLQFHDSSPPTTSYEDQWTTYVRRSVTCYRMASLRMQIYITLRTMIRRERYQNGMKDEDGWN